jgi:hypothetical protein
VCRSNDGPSAADALGLEVSLGSFLQNQFVQSQIGHGTFQPAILTLQLLEPFLLIDLQAPYSFRQRQ